jgi:hypothetical protein
MGNGIGINNLNVIVVNVEVAVVHKDKGRFVHGEHKDGTGTHV